MSGLDAVVGQQICQNPGTPSIGLDESERLLSAADIAMLRASDPADEDRL
jgi:hypothetical protein